MNSENSIPDAAQGFHEQQLVDQYSQVKMRLAEELGIPPDELPNRLQKLRTPDSEGDEGNNQVFQAIERLPMEMRQEAYRLVISVVHPS